MTRPAGAVRSFDEYLDRGKYRPEVARPADLASFDVVIVDGMNPFSRASHQIVVRVVAALPGDEAYGDLPPDCSEDLLNALVGFFTDMGTTSRYLGRPVVYTPLPLCSVYTGVNAAVATAAALVDRLRSGQGREIIASRIAGGLSAIGALALTSHGLPSHLAPANITGVPHGVTPEKFKALVSAASTNPAMQLHLERRIFPFAAPYATSDGKLALPLAAPNRRLGSRLLKALNIWDEALAAGMVDVNPYDPINAVHAGKNLADSMSLDFNLREKLAELLERAFATKSADDWEAGLNRAGVPCVKIRSFHEWMEDTAAREARIIAPVEGVSTYQIGRSAWLASAQPYPSLRACRTAEFAESLTSNNPGRAAMVPRSQSPLRGFVVLDLCNVIAGPNCCRMLVELGATVYKVDPHDPQHAPIVMTTWAGESGVGKQSIILNLTLPDGRAVLDRLVRRADLVVANKLDAQFDRLGLGRESIRLINPKAVVVQLSAHRGEKNGPRHDYPGYDPVIQGITGIMVRFGRSGCPTYHGVASSVDYLCGYLGAWAATTALYAREFRNDGTGDWAETSLAAAASLTQILLQTEDEPASARGLDATGPTPEARTVALRDGWIFVQGDLLQLAAVAPMSTDQALAFLKQHGIPAARVQTCRDLAERHRGSPSKTVIFAKRGSDGWETECFAPTWFHFDGVSVSRPAATTRIGSDRTHILAELGFTDEEGADFIARGAVADTEFRPR